MQYCMGFRLKVLDLYNREHNNAKVARLLQIDEKTVCSFIKKRQADQLEPRKPGPKKPTKITPEDEEKIWRLMAANPSITFKDLIDNISVDVAPSTISRTLKRLGISLKKSRKCPSNINAKM